MKNPTLFSIFVFLVYASAALAQNENSTISSCDETESRQFDFWIGEWAIKQKILKADGKWFEAEAETSIQPVMGGCALAEHWSGEVLFFWEGMKKPKSIKGYSFRFFNPKTQKWIIHWMDTRSRQFSVFKGGFADGKGGFFRTFKSPDGKETIARITFSDITKSSVHWDLTVSSDGGKTWQMLWVMEMTKK